MVVKHGIFLDAVDRVVWILFTEIWSQINILVWIDMTVVYLIACRKTGVEVGYYPL